MLRLVPLLGNRQYLDGGAMFGNAPRALWSRWHPPDEVGRIELACRAALVDEGHRKVLLEAGIGAFFEPKLRARYGVVEDRHVLLDSLAAEGLSHEDIDVVVLSHLHSDHAGGLLSAWQKDKALELLFPKATFVVGKGAFERAKHPHSRDRASFIPELLDLLEASQRLVVVDGDRTTVLGDHFRLRESNGHTPGMMLTQVTGLRQSAIFCADLVPGASWVHLPITMGYDRYPEMLIDEKAALFDELFKDQSWLFFTHDPKVAMARLSRDESGKYSPAAARTDKDGAVDLDA
ncbi:MAG: MBL fold metallo-hydrolase [Polyangiaceae bacterium]|nr:MBL fold metallo-hydrolase [Polyangiaceae bacterium]